MLGLRSELGREEGKGAKNNSLIYCISRLGGCHPPSKTELALAMIMAAAPVLAHLDPLRGLRAMRHAEETSSRESSLEGPGMRWGAAGSPGPETLSPLRATGEMVSPFLEMHELRKAPTESFPPRHGACGPAPSWQAELNNGRDPKSSG